MKVYHLIRRGVKSMDKLEQIIEELGITVEDLPEELLDEEPEEVHVYGTDE